MNRYPWRNSSEDIAENTPSQWETPLGAQEKADKAEENAKEYSDEKLNEHKGKGGAEHPIVTNDDAGFMSSEDKEKLDGIEDEAEKNVNAFGQVNTLNADNPQDSLTIKGGIGILITENPNNNEITVTATSEAIPGAHGITHTEFGADPIPNATTDEGGLMSADDKVELEQLKIVPSALSDLAGAGRTTETVKGNADALAAHMNESVTSADSGKKLKAIGCVLRNAGDGWFIIDDEGHIPIGFTDVSVNESNNLQLTHSIGAAKVVNLVVTPDEAFAGQGIFVGASVGTSTSAIEIFAEMKSDIDTGILTTTDQDFFSAAGTKIQARLSTDRIIITHGNSSDLLSPIVDFFGSNSHEVTTIIARTTTTTTIRCFKDYIGRWYYDGDAWTEEFSNMNAGAVTVSWAGGTLQVIHPPKTTATPSMVTGVAENVVTNYNSSPTSTSFRIRFLDKEHAAITSPIAGMRVDMRIQGVSQISSGALLSNLGRIRVSGLHTKLNANDVVSSSGNLWVTGLMYFDPES